MSKWLITWNTGFIPMASNYILLDQICNNVLKKCLISSNNAGAENQKIDPCSWKFINFCKTNVWAFLWTKSIVFFFGYIPHHVNFRSILCNIPIWYTKKDLDGPSITPPKKWIALKFKFLRMLQILLYLYERKTHLVLIVFILSNFHFSLMNALFYIVIDRGIHK